MGYAEVVKVLDATARVRVTLTDAEQLSRPGDLIGINCWIPRRERGILFALAALEVDLRNADPEQRYYTFDSLYAGLPAKGTNTILASMLERIRASGREYGEMEALQTILPAGRYKGRKIADLMTGATRKELTDFFRFILSYPGKYIGKVWRIDEIYATWLSNNAPYSPNELVEEIIAAATLARRRELLAAAPDLRADVLSELMQRSRVAAENANRTKRASCWNSPRACAKRAMNPPPHWNSPFRVQA